MTRGLFHYCLHKPVIKLPQGFRSPAPSMATFTDSLTPLFLRRSLPENCRDFPLTSRFSQGSDPLWSLVVWRWLESDRIWDWKQHLVTRPTSWPVSTDVKPSFLPKSPMYFEKSVKFSDKNIIYYYKLIAILKPPVATKTHFTRIKIPSLNRPTVR